MILSNKILDLFTMQRHCYLTICRFVRIGPIVFDNTLRFHPKHKKITVIKKKLFNKEMPSVIEWKLASDVIKALNFEYTCVYGPIQKDENCKGKFIGFQHNGIVQHETSVPVIEPVVDPNSSLRNDDQQIDLSSILTFPLINKHAYRSGRINQLNILRKKLEFLCKDAAIPSVSLILQSTMPKTRKEILDKWKQNMISELGEEGFEKYQSELFANGASLHHTICSFLVSTPESELPIKEENIGHWKSLKHVFPNITDVKLLEEFVAHPFLCYRGVVDCFAKYKDNLVVIDWKTSKKSKANIKNMYDNPLQIAAYVGALNFDPKYQYLASKGLIAVAYENGMPATVHYLDELTMKHYWNEWLQRVKQYWEMRILKTVTS